MSFWEHLGLFSIQTFLIVAGIILIMIVAASLVARAKIQESFRVENLGEKLDDAKQEVLSHILSKKDFKKWLKGFRKEHQEQSKRTDKERVFVLEFEGDIRASKVETFRKEVSVVLATAKRGDKVVVLLESAGGLVHTYGLAASQLTRIKSAGLSLTVCVDKVAASGGYLMACVADRILAAPFALIGSIGVVAQVPNVHRLLNKNEIDYEEITAGAYKRTVSLFAPITPEGRKKFQEQIEETHDLFKRFVKDSRPVVNLEKVATGEYWYGVQAVELGLIDEIRTSDEFLMKASETADVFKLTLGAKKKISERLAESVNLFIESVLDKTLSRIKQSGQL